MGDANIAATGVTTCFDLVIVVEDIHHKANNKMTNTGEHVKKGTK